MDGDGPHIMARTQRAQRPPAPAPAATAPVPAYGQAAWPLGPWNLSARAPHCPPPLASSMSSTHAPWPAAPAHVNMVNVYEDLYPDSSAPTRPLDDRDDPFSSAVTPDMVLPALSAFPTYQQYTIQVRLTRHSPGRSLGQMIADTDLKLGCLTAVC